VGYILQSSRRILEADAVEGNAISWAITISRYRQA
jgi:hypothetical protein